MADEPTTTAEDPAEEPTTDDATGADEQEGQKGGGDGEAQFTQADLDRIVGERLERERKKAEAAAEKAKKEAEAKALEEQQEWQKLAEKRAGRIEELETIESQLTEATERIETLETTLAGYVDKLTDGLPDHIATLLSKMDVVERLDYITKHGKELSVRPANVPETPAPNSSDDAATRETKKKNKSALGAQVRSWI